jgi:hypothetical protein
MSRVRPRAAGSCLDADPITVIGKTETWVLLCEVQIREEEAPAVFLVVGAGLGVDWNFCRIEEGIGESTCTRVVRQIHCLLQRIPPRSYRQCRGAGKGPAVKPLLGDIPKIHSPMGPRAALSYKATISLGGAGSC